LAWKGPVGNMLRKLERAAGLNKREGETLASRARSAFARWSGGEVIWRKLACRTDDSASALPWPLVSQMNPDSSLGHSGAIGAVMHRGQFDGQWRSTPPCLAPAVTLPN
jgi:hypothetical protein